CVVRHMSVSLPFPYTTLFRSPFLGSFRGPWPPGRWLCGSSSATSSPVRVGGVTNTVTDEVEYQHGHRHRSPRKQHPRCTRDRVDVLCLLEQDTPANDRCLQT